MSQSMNNAPDVTLDFYPFQNVGKRKNQEDYIVCQPLDGPTPDAPKSVLGVLADGMGGLEGGEIASTVVGKTFLRTVREAARSAETEDSEPDILLYAMQQANEALRQRKELESAELNSMGSTLCAAWVKGTRLFFLSVGDSLVYLMRGTCLYRLNHLHNFREDARRNAQLNGQNWDIISQSPEIVRFGSRVTSYMGGGQITQADCPAGAIELQPGDTVLLSSDGLLTLSPREIASLLEYDSPSGISSAREIACSLVESTIEKDAPRQDNVSVVVIRLTQDA